MHVILNKYDNISNEKEPHHGRDLDNYLSLGKCHAQANTTFSIIILFPKKWDKEKHYLYKNYNSNFSTKARTLISKWDSCSWWNIMEMKYFDQNYPKNNLVYWFYYNILITTIYSYEQSITYYYKLMWLH